MEGNLSVVLGIMIAVLPATVAAAVFAGRSRAAWLCFGIGATGWLVALLLRWIPLQLPLYADASLGGSVIYFAYAALLAGIFEEGIRYVLIRKVGLLRTARRTICMGIGWGLFEAVLLYAVNLAAAAYLLGYETGFLDLLPGAVERNTAIVFHTALTLIVFKALESREYLLVAIALHALLDFLGVVSLYIFRLTVWQVEGVIAATALITLLYAVMLHGWVLRMGRRPGGAWPATEGGGAGKNLSGYTGLR